MKRMPKKGPVVRAAEGKPRRHEQVQVVIRKAKRSDLAAIVKMSNGVREIENYPGQKMKAEDFAHFVSGYGALMLVAVGSRSARAKTEVAGYVTVYKSENYFYLPYAVTKKEWRRHGVGGALLNEVERLAKEEKVEYILMSVYVYNSSVHNFLRVRGYVPSKRLVQYSKTITTKGRK
jgi:ribosomal protein S18 acetylase RimI-like enzyme